MPTILITGANRGIGLALTEKFLTEGWHVLATAREPEHATDLHALAASSGHRLDILPLDVANPESTDRLAARVAGVTTQLDVLVNNAGLFPEEGDEHFIQMKPEWFEQAYAVNVVGSVRVTQALLPLLRRGDHPRLILMSSGAGSVTKKADHTKLAYACSKTAVNMLARGLAADLKDDGVIVIPLCPGWVKTPMGGPNAKITTEESAQMIFGTLTSLTMEQSGQIIGPDGSQTTYQW